MNTPPSAEPTGQEMGTLVGSTGRGPATPRVGFFARLTDAQAAWLVVLVGLALYIPFAGTYGLWDPWETHYSEVARQMTKRGDFISLWWPGSPRDPGGGFWSKPVLTFWIMSLGMHVAGVGLRGGPPDEMVSGWKAEWAVRVPFCLLGVVAMWAVYTIVARFVGRRAGFLSALVMATCPMFSLVARQAMTDMPFVAPMAVALALGALALLDDKDEVLPRRGRGWSSWPHHPSFYVTVGLFALLVIPQLVIDSLQLRVHLPWGGKDRVMYGAVAMIPYYVGFLAFVFFAARFRYRAPLYMSIAAMMCGLAVLAKGLAGLGLPVIVFVAYLAFTWNWKRLRRAQLLPGLAVAALALLVVAVPWHHAMFLRHGMPWWNELFGDNHWRRMVLGRHGDRGAFDYFLRELGYATLPWLAIAPAALVAVVTRRGTDAKRQAIYWLGAIWFVASYAVVSSSMTKFHHYILPGVPGLAIVIGCFLDDLFERRDARRGLLAVLAGLPLLLLVVHDLTSSPSAAQLFLWLFSYDYVHSPQGRPWPTELDFSTPLLVFGIVFAAFTAALGVRKLVRVGVIGLCVSAMGFTWFLLDRYMRDVAPFWSQKYGIAEYYKHRRSPDERLGAYLMYWRGETFYTKNEIYEGPEERRTVFDDPSNNDVADQKLQAWVRNNRGRRIYFIFERSRQGHLESLLPPESRASFTVIYKQNNKFSVAYADI